jgi:hypothetical protein
MRSRLDERSHVQDQAVRADLTGATIDGSRPDERWHGVAVERRSAKRDAESYEAFGEGSGDAVIGPVRNTLCWRARAIDWAMLLCNPRIGMHCIENVGR